MNQLKVFLNFYLIKNTKISENELEEDLEIEEVEEEEISNLNNFVNGEESNLCDEDIALDNLIFAEGIYKEFLNEFIGDDLTAKQTEANVEIKKEIFGLAEVYLKMGDLETCKSDFPSAVEKYSKALKIRKQFDEKFSRCIAEIYFNLHKVYDFDALKCFSCLVKARLIMEYHIKNKLEKLEKKDISEQIPIDDSLLEMDEIDHTKIKMKNLIYYENNEFIEGKLPNDVIDLTEIVKELDIKVL